VKNTNCEAPHYVDFSNLLLFHSPFAQIFSSAPSSQYLQSMLFPWCRRPPIFFKIPPFRFLDQHFLHVSSLLYVLQAPSSVALLNHAKNSKSNEFRKSSQIMALLIGIREVSSSNLDRDINYHVRFRVFSPNPSSKMPNNNALNQSMSTFHVHSNSPSSFIAIVPQLLTASLNKQQTNEETSPMPCITFRIMLIFRTKIC
jgi:hypothetical protein